MLHERLMLARGHGPRAKREHTIHIPYIAENFRGRNFSEFHGFVAIRESFLRKIFLHENLIFHQLAKKFSL